MVAAEYVPVYDFKLGNWPHESAIVWQVQSYLISSEWEAVKCGTARVRTMQFVYWWRGRGGYDFYF